MQDDENLILQLFKNVTIFETTNISVLLENELLITNANVKENNQIIAMRKAYFHWTRQSCSKLLTISQERVRHAPTDHQCFMHV